VTIIEPNETLKIQTGEMLGLVDFGITIVTMDWFYQHGSRDDIIIINEYDMILDNQYYTINNNAITGVWSLKNFKVIAFSATTSTSLERYVNNCISRPTVLKFTSEYELIHGTTSIQDGHIIACGSRKNMLTNL
jgi:hypothetical protein